jgi:hypothetical protein
MLRPNEKYGAFDHLIGEKLAAVTFVWEYYQLLIGTTTLTMYAAPTVQLGSAVFSQHTPGFRDALCQRVGAEVRDVIDTDQELSLELSDGGSVNVSLRPRDRVGGGSESLVATGPDGQITVIGDS